MNILGLTITRTKAAVSPMTVSNFSSNGWWPLIREAFTGAWQRNINVSAQDCLSHSTVFACATLIAQDIAKVRIKLTQTDDDGISSEVATNSPFLPVLQKPNEYQNRIQFVQTWLLSKLLHGNAYALKARDSRGIVTDLYLLDPARVRPLVAENGDVYYALGTDLLAGVTTERTVVPALEIIHDLYVAPYHPLCGVSPITACGLPALQGLKIQHNSYEFFSKGAQLSGLLLVPGSISTENATKLREQWEQEYMGEGNHGRLAVLSDGMKFQPLTMTAVDAQLIEQLRLSDEKICSAFHVPPYMVGVGAMPNYNNIEALNQQYYSQCLQVLIESLELCLDEGLGLESVGYETEVDLDGLLRMDSATKMKTATDGVRGGIYTPNEGRALFNKKPLTGGDTVYLQEQDHSLAALAKRDAQPDPFSNVRETFTGPTAAPAPPPEGDTAKAIALLPSIYRKELEAA